MRRVGFVTAVILSSSLVVAVPDRAAAAISIGVSLNFRDSLAPHGDWVQHERFGAVWSPRHVDHAWRPYTHGHWVYTDYDWTWVSDEEWGWATDHYGRWYLDPSEGWIWIPGEEWAPAWVAWRHGGGYVGWAPLPPDVDVFRAGLDLRIDPFAYSFVEERRLLEPAVYRAFVPIARNVTYVNLTQNITNYTRIDTRVVNRGLDVQQVERFTGRAVPRGRIREVSSVSEARGARVQGGQVPVFRPPVAAVRPEAEAHVSLARPRAAAERPDQVIRRQEQERQRLESAEQRERADLRKIHEREVQHPPVVIDDRVAAQPRGRPAPVDREQLRGRHEAEQKAQAEHEQRERQMLQQRHERENRAGATHPQNERPANPPKKHGDR